MRNVLLSSVLYSVFCGLITKTMKERHNLQPHNKKETVEEKKATVRNGTAINAVNVISSNQGTRFSSLSVLTCELEHGCGKDTFHSANGISFDAIHTPPEGLQIDNNKLEVRFSREKRKTMIPYNGKEKLVERKNLSSQNIELVERKNL
ncbi:hypothetical protein TNCV_4213141 [Trichonephila clavipes]|nr:hypothetical protein TNCV_4213141 [Trichonephila clavipes]